MVQATTIADDIIQPGDGAMHLLCTTSTGHWHRLLRRYGPVEREARRRAVAIWLWSMLGVSARLEHRLWWSRRIDRADIAHPPIFVLGHWRSGTSWLHELLATNKALGFVSMWQAMAPQSIIAGRWVRHLFGWAVPQTRPMDDIALTMETPFEEEAAMAALGDVSQYHCFYFPRHAEQHFRRAVLFEGLTDREIAQWKRDLRHVLQAVTLARGGKRLVLKNPAHTARIPTLLEMFPEARFIHIYRNPYTVYASTLRMRVKMVQRLGLQRASRCDLERQIIDQYRAVMTRYFDTRDLIPSGRLVEVRYEDLERDPLAELRRTYEQLGLGDFSRARPAIQQHLHSRRDYRKNEHQLDAVTIGHVTEQWAFAIERWGYDAPR